MKYLRMGTCVIFVLLILIPLVTFNWEQDAISLIDNRKLAANPFSGTEGDLTTAIEYFVNDRIGLRDEMILGYTVLNDRLFGKMVHPSYVYGKDGYVFGAGLTVRGEFTDYHAVFARMVKQMQDYCDARSIPFLFVFNPAKPAVLTEYIAAGTNYDRRWVDTFLQTLDEYGVRYLDNTVVLREKTEAGEVVFNQKYDANHWNDLGAFYGVNAILEELKKDFPTVHVNTLNEFTVSEKLETTLPVSEFPISEYVPVMTLNAKFDYLTGQYTELERHPSFQGFGYYVNQVRQSEGSPRALVFQGSYMNGFGYKYMINGLGEYIYVHDYQNVLNLPYYINIFQPDCVIFEVAEYTFTDTYFDYEAMVDLQLNPALKDVKSQADTIQTLPLSQDVLTVESGQALTKIHWHSDTGSKYAWLECGEVFDMARSEAGFVVTVTNADFAAYGNTLRIYTAQGSSVNIYEYQK